MKLRRLSFLLISGAYFFLTLETRILAELSNAPNSRSTEERLAAIEEKLQRLENRLDQALGTGAQKLGAPEATGETGTMPPITEQLAALDQKLRIVEQKKELDGEVMASKLKEMPVISAGKEGFWIRSADNNFQLRVGGIIQADSRFYTQSDPAIFLGSSTFLLRKARPILEGTVYKFFDYKLMADFGNGQAIVQDAYLDFNYFSRAKTRSGKFKPPVGLERLQADVNNIFVERALPSDLVPNRDVGVQVFGENLRGVFDYALGVFNGVVDGGNGDLDTNNTKDFAGRVFVNPFKTSNIASLKGLGIGFAGTSGSQQGPLPVFRTPAQAIFFNYTPSAVANGNRYLITPQAYYYVGPFGMLGEYVQTAQDVKNGNNFGEISTSAWQVAASYVITGEKASFKSVIPRKEFNPGAGSFGAVELAGRYTQLNVDNEAFILKFANSNVSSSRASTWTAGVNWYFNRNLRVQLNYEQSAFKGGSTTGNRQTEKVILSRFQVAF